MYFNQRNYDKWAECVAHDPMTYFTWTTPFGGEDDVFEAKGWDEVSKAFKGFMEKWPADENIPKKENYQFKINGNMAFVRLSQNGQSEETRVLEKKDGKWRILQMQSLASNAFRKFQQLHALHRMAGTWVIDIPSYKKDGGDWSLVSTIIEITPTPAGITSSERSLFRTAEGELRVYQEEATASLNMQNGTIGMFSTSIFPYSNWTQASYGTGSFDQAGALHSKSSPVGGDSISEGKMWMDGDAIYVTGETKNKEGKTVFSTSYKMTRKGAEKETVKP